MTTMDHDAKMPAALLLELWKAALLESHPALGDPRDAVVRELSEYFHLPEADVR